MFDLEKFKTGEYYVHLPTRKNFGEIMEYLNKNNIKWTNGDSLKDDVDSTWKISMGSTCIIYKKNDYSEGVVLGNLSYFKECGYIELNEVSEDTSEQLELLNISARELATTKHKSEKDAADAFNHNFEIEKGDIDMKEKIIRDLIKLLFEKEFNNHELDGMREYKGRIIFDYFHRSAKFIDFIEMINENYSIKGYEAAKIIIEEFDIKEYSED